MEAAIITHRGLENVAKVEVKELIDVDATTSDSLAFFSTDSYADIFKVCYASQSAAHVIELLKKGEIKELDDVKPLANSIPDEVLKKWVPDGCTFAVKCIRDGKHDFSSRDIEEEVGEAIFKKLKPKIDLKSPDVVLLVYVVGEACYMGIDLVGFDLSKRDYKVFQYGTANKGTVAYSLLRIADYSSNKVVVDPFAGMGFIAIEAALLSTKRSPHFHQKDKFAFQNFPCFKDTDFDSLFRKIDSDTQKDHAKIWCIDSQLKHIKASQQNAKVAGINKHINFSRADIEWLDTKFDLESVDCIVSIPPQPSKRVPEKKLKKVYDDLFYSAKEILKQDGVVVLLIRKSELLLELAKRKGFVLDKKLQIYQGKEESDVLILKKGQTAEEK